MPGVCQQIHIHNMEFTFCDCKQPLYFDDLIHQSLRSKLRYNAIDECEYKNGEGNFYVWNFGSATYYINMAIDENCAIMIGDEKAVIDWGIYKIFANVDRAKNRVVFDITKYFTVQNDKYRLDIEYYMYNEHHLSIRGYVDIIYDGFAFKYMVSAGSIGSDFVAPGTELMTTIKKISGYFVDTTIRCIRELVTLPGYKITKLLNVLKPKEK